MDFRRPAGDLSGGRHHNVKFGFTSQPWALPVLCTLYRPAELNRSEGRRRKMPIDLAMQLMATLIHWFPRRKLVLPGDGGYASHEPAWFCHRHRRHVTLLGRFHPQANLYTLPPKGKRFTVNGYGGKTRRVELIWGEGQWNKAGAGLVPVRWVFVHDIEGTHRDEYSYSTEATMPPDKIVSPYTGRWSIEVRFQEVHAPVGFATARNGSIKSVLRTAPCLLGLFSVVSLILHRHTRGEGVPPAQWAWYAKAQTSFGDAMTCVRRLCWAEVFQQSPKHADVTKLSRPLRIMLLDQLSRAA